jgi:hypothetical protein
MMRRNNTFLQKLLEVSLLCFHFSLMFFEGEVKSPCFLQVCPDIYVFITITGAVVVMIVWLLDL